MRKEIERTYGGTIPENLEELISRLESTDNREVGRKARKEEDKGDFKPGVIGAVKQIIQDRNRSNQGPSRSAQDSRIDHILRTTDSSGRAKARKW